MSLVERAGLGTVCLPWLRGGVPTIVPTLNGWENAELRTQHALRVRDVQGDGPPLTGELADALDERYLLEALYARLRKVDPELTRESFGTHVPNRLALLEVARAVAGADEARFPQGPPRSTATGAHEGNAPGSTGGNSRNAPRNGWRAWLRSRFSRA